MKAYIIGAKPETQQMLPNVRIFRACRCNEDSNKQDFGSIPARESCKIEMLEESSISTRPLYQCIDR